MVLLDIQQLADRPNSEPFQAASSSGALSSLTQAARRIGAHLEHTRIRSAAVKEVAALCRKVSALWKAPAYRAGYLACARELQELAELAACDEWEDELRSALKRQRPGGSGSFVAPVAQRGRLH